MVKNYDPHKKYKRVGECLNCGNCCVGGCELLQFKAARKIEKGEVISTPKDFRKFCLAYNPLSYGHQQYLEQGCDRFPTSPLSTPNGCGYHWELDE